MLSPLYTYCPVLTCVVQALRPEERCHINLLALEARRQAALLYGLHAVMLYMSSR